MNGVIMGREVIQKLEEVATEDWVRSIWIEHTEQTEESISIVKVV